MVEQRKTRLPRGTFVGTKTTMLEKMEVQDER